jgi:hypothetical protein
VQALGYGKIPKITGEFILLKNARIFVPGGRRDSIKEY